MTSFIFILVHNLQYMMNIVLKKKFFFKNIYKNENDLMEVQWDNERSSKIKKYIFFRIVEEMT